MTLTPFRLQKKEQVGWAQLLSLPLHDGKACGVVVVPSGGNSNPSRYQGQVVQLRPQGGLSQFAKLQIYAEMILKLELTLTLAFFGHFIEKTA